MLYTCSSTRLSWHYLKINLILPLKKLPKLVVAADVNSLLSSSLFLLTFSFVCLMPCWQHGIIQIFLAWESKFAEFVRNRPYTCNIIYYSNNNSHKQCICRYKATFLHTKTFTMLVGYLNSWFEGQWKLMTDVDLHFSTRWKLAILAGTIKQGVLYIDIYEHCSIFCKNCKNQNLSSFKKRLELCILIYNVHVLVNRKKLNIMLCD